MRSSRRVHHRIPARDAGASECVRGLRRPRLTEDARIISHPADPIRSSQFHQQITQSAIELMEEKLILCVCSALDV